MVKMRVSMPFFLLLTRGARNDGFPSTRRSLSRSPPEVCVQLLTRRFRYELRPSEAESDNTSAFWKSAWPSWRDMPKMGVALPPGMPCDCEEWPPLAPRLPGSSNASLFASLLLQSLRHWPPPAWAVDAVAAGARFAAAAGVPKGVLPGGSGGCMGRAAAGGLAASEAAGAAWGHMARTMAGAAPSPVAAFAEAALPTAVLAAGAAAGALPAAACLVSAAATAATSGGAAPCLDSADASAAPGAAACLDSAAASAATGAAASPPSASPPSAAAVAFCVGGGSGA
mmetsp:Transcript_43879/g.113332  ORF Transcript_43879/g.113332 Transcript_43879/m.113332 type:complete len:284 (-) Transcript_43879:567-1418(-)